MLFGAVLVHRQYTGGHNIAIEAYIHKTYNSLCTLQILFLSYREQ